MRTIKGAAFVALVATLVTAATASAQTQSFTGNTTGCFGTGCTTSHSSSNGLGVGFTGLNGFNWSAISGASQTVNLGTFNFGAFACSGLLCQPDDFTLQTSFITPPTVPTTGTYFADVHALFLFNRGGANVDFDNTPQTFNFANGFATLTVNDVTAAKYGGNYNVTGTLLYTSTPEPSSMALLGTGLVGLVPMVRRRRK